MATPIQPKMTVHYKDPDFELIPPDEVEKLEKTKYGAFIVSPTVLCHKNKRIEPSKAGYEVKNLLFVKEHTTIPVPKVYGCYTFGPIPVPGLGMNLTNFYDEDPPIYVTYTFLEDIKGDLIADTWDRLNGFARRILSDELAGYVKQLQDLGEGTYVGSLDKGQVGDNIIGINVKNHGPFETVEEFHRTLAEAWFFYDKKDPNPLKDKMIADLNAEKFKIKFCHGHLQDRHLIHKDGHLVGIIGWQFAGWYPSYWEYFGAVRDDLRTQEQLSYFHDHAWQYEAARLVFTNNAIEKPDSLTYKIVRTISGAIGHDREYTID